MASRTSIFITGANTGIGFEVVKALCRSSKAYEIILGSRDVKKGKDAIAAAKTESPQTQSTLSLVQIDVSSDDSISQAIKEITSKHDKLDCLINNAGAGFDGKIQSGEMSARDAFNESWNTNVTGAHVLTGAVMPLLIKSSDPRLLFVTSGTSSLVETEDHENPMLARINASPEKGWPKKQQNNPITSYRSTKTGLNMVMREWTRLLKNDGVKVWAISPGFLATGLGGVGVEQLKKMGAGEPSLGGEFIKDVIEGKRDDQTGKVIRSTAVQQW